MDYRSSSSHRPWFLATHRLLHFVRRMDTAVPQEALGHREHLQHTSQTNDADLMIKDMLNYRHSQHLTKGTSVFANPLWPNFYPFFSSRHWLSILQRSVVHVFGNCFFSSFFILREREKEPRGKDRFQQCLTKDLQQHTDSCSGMKNVFLIQVCPFPDRVLELSGAKDCSGRRVNPTAWLSGHEF